MTTQDLDGELDKVLLHAGVSKGIHRIVGSGQLDGNNRIAPADMLDEAKAQLKAIIEREVLAARVSELEELRPPEQYKEYALFMGSEACRICGFNSEVFRKHVDDRIQALRQQEEK